MDRLQFQPNSSEDVTALYRRLGGAIPPEAERNAWEATAAALFGVLAVADAFGLGPAGREALDARLAGVAQAVAQGQWIAFEAGLQVGTTLAALLGPCLN